MTIETIRAFFGWCSLINIVLLFVWWLFFMLTHKLIYRIHSKWFKITDEMFHDACYRIAGVYKVGILLFNLIPYVVLRIIA